MSNELKTIEGEITPAAMLKAAIDRGTDISQLSSLMALYEKFEANRARAAFNQAIAEFKTNPPQIFKTKAVEFNKTKYKHALLEDIVDIVTPALCAHGLSVRWDVQQNEQVSVTCVLSHIAGHSESVTMKGPADDSGSKNKIQQIGSTVSYLQRYTLMSILGLAARGADDDGHAAISKHSNSNLITDEQVMEIEAFINDHELPIWPVMKYLKSKGHENFAELPAKSFEQFMATLKRSAAAKDKANDNHHIEQDSCPLSL